MVFRVRARETVLIDCIPSRASLCHDARGGYAGGRFRHCAVVRVFCHLALTRWQHSTDESGTWVVAVAPSQVCCDGSTLARFWRRVNIDFFFHWIVEQT